MQAFLQYAPGVLTAPSAESPGTNMAMGGQLVVAYGEAGERAQAVVDGIHPDGIVGDVGRRSALVRAPSSSSLGLDRFSL